MTKPDVLTGLCYELTYAIVEYTEASIAGVAPRIKQRDAIHAAVLAIARHLQVAPPWAGLPPSTSPYGGLAERQARELAAAAQPACPDCGGHHPTHKATASLACLACGTTWSPAPACGDRPSYLGPAYQPCGKPAGHLDHHHHEATPPETTEPGRSSPETNPQDIPSILAQVARHKP